MNSRQVCLSKGQLVVCAILGVSFGLGRNYLANFHPCPQSHRGGLLGHRVSVLLAPVRGLRRARGIPPESSLGAFLRGSFGLRLPNPDGIASRGAASCLLAAVPPPYVSGEPQQRHHGPAHDVLHAHGAWREVDNRAAPRFRHAGVWGHHVSVLRGWPL